LVFASRKACRLPFTACGGLFVSGGL